MCVYSLLLSDVIRDQLNISLLGNTGWLDVAEHEGVVLLTDMLLSVCLLFLNH